MVETLSHASVQTVTMTKSGEGCGVTCEVHVQGSKGWNKGAASFCMTSAVYHKSSIIAPQSRESTEEVDKRCVLVVSFLSI